MRELTFAYFGKENALKEEALEDFKKRLLTVDNIDLNYTLFYSDQLEPEAFQDAVNTQPFLSPKRFVVIKDIERLQESTKNSIVSYLKKPSKNTVLVLMTDLEIKNSEEDSFFSSILKYARVQAFESLEAMSLHRYLIKKLTLYKKTMTDEAIKLLIEKLGNDLKLLEKAIEELTTYVGTKPKIEKGDVETLVGKSLEETVFTLTKAICHRQTAQSLSILSSLFKESVSPENIIGAIGAEFRRIMKVKYLMAQERSAWQIQGELRLNQRTVTEAMNVAKNITLSDIKKCFGHLVKADRDCKNRDLDRRVVLESLVVRLCDFAELA